jgi:secondary thiamine-phosphate synthase enzyme
MKSHSTQIKVRTAKRSEIVEITERVAESVRESGISEGLATVTALHTTCALIINEGEPRLLEDIRDLLSKMIPEGGGYRHDQIDDNAHAHLRSILLSPTVVIPVQGRRLVLGRWQAVLLVESDGPRERTVLVQTMGV